MLLFSYGGCYILNLSHLMVMLLFGYGGCYILNLSLSLNLSSWTCASWYCNRCDRNLFLPLVIYISVILYCGFLSLSFGWKIWIYIFLFVTVILISVLYLGMWLSFLSLSFCGFFYCYFNAYEGKMDSSIFEFLYSPFLELTMTKWMFNFIAYWVKNACK
jgi:hypothetical protein